MPVILALGIPNPPIPLWDLELARSRIWPGANFTWKILGIFCLKRAGDPAGMPEQLECQNIWISGAVLEDHRIIQMDTTDNPENPGAPAGTGVVLKVSFWR